jgi:hypothetical protein
MKVLREAARLARDIRQSRRHRRDVDLHVQRTYQRDCEAYEAAVNNARHSLTETE